MSDRKLWIVTASANPFKTKEWHNTWAQRSGQELKRRAVMVWNGASQYQGEITRVQLDTGALIITGDYLGVVPAFCLGLQAVIHRAAPQDVIACLHDDVAILEQNWDQKVLAHFDQHPRTCLAGFFGATGLGAPDIYKTPYNPMQLARMDCWSNMDDAEAHGQRSTEAKRVVVLDGFSQIMSVEFAKYAVAYLQESGITHHGYDGVLGCLAARWARQRRWRDDDDGVPTGVRSSEVWMIPIACHHAGGQTAVGDVGYQAWAKTKIENGDQGFWEAAHRIWYDGFRDVLPLRLKE